MRTLAATTLTTLALTSLVACGSDNQSAADLGCGDGPEVEVTETGSEPLKELELSPTEGDSVKLDTEMDMSMSIRADGSTQPTGSIPTITLGMAATVERVGDDEIEMSFEYDKVSAGGDEAVEDTLDGLVGTSGTITTDANGVYLDGDIEPAPGMNEAMRSILQQFEQQFANLTVPLPSEAIGQGAEWEVTTPIEINDVEACNSYTYTLSELDGSQYALDVEIGQEMAAGSIEESGIEAELIEGSTSGTGQMRGDLSLPLAVTGSNEVSSSMSMEVEQGDDTRELETDTDVTVTIEQRGGSAGAES